MKANLTPTQPKLTKQTVQSAAELQVQIHQRAHELYYGIFAAELLGWHRR